MSLLKIAVHPGEILKEFLDDYNLKATTLARAIRVPPNRITQILAGKRSITADTAMRLGHYFGNRPAFWMNIQQHYDFIQVQKESAEEIAGLPKLEAA